MQAPAKNILRAKTIRAKARVALRLRIRPDGTDDLRLDQRLDRRELGGEAWVVEGTPLAKNQVVEYALRRLATQEDGLPTICETAGMPDLRTFVGWLNHNPEWKKAWKEAEECHALVAVDRGHRRARASGGELAQVKGDELYLKSCMWKAERLDRKKWSEKGEGMDLGDPLSQATEGQLISRIVAALMAAPAMLDALAPRLKQLLPPERLAEIEERVLAARQAQAVEAEVIQ